MNETILQSEHDHGDNQLVIRLADVEMSSVSRLLSRYGLSLKTIESGCEIPGSYWGDEEAGLIGDDLLVRTDTPLHSVLHETCHYICMDKSRREGVHTDAGGDYDEENAVCYLQILLSDHIEHFGRLRMFRDMDRWGYTFRLGSARAWFEEDADDARVYLLNLGLIDQQGQPTFRLREF
jgi:hypothetical protein